MSAGQFLDVVIELTYLRGAGAIDGFRNIESASLEYMSKSILSKLDKIEHRAIQRYRELAYCIDM